MCGWRGPQKNVGKWKYGLYLYRPTKEQMNTNMRVIPMLITNLAWTAPTNLHWPFNPQLCKWASLSDDHVRRFVLKLTCLAALTAPVWHRRSELLVFWPESLLLSSYRQGLYRVFFIYLFFLLFFKFAFIVNLSHPHILMFVVALPWYIY